MNSVFLELGVIYPLTLAHGLVSMAAIAISSSSLGSDGDASSRRLHSSRRPPTDLPSEKSKAGQSRPLDYVLRDP